MRIEVIPKRQQRASWHVCVNRCFAWNGTQKTGDYHKAHTGLRQASHIMWMLEGCPVYLCRFCIKDWKQMWEEALEGDVDAG